MKITDLQVMRIASEGTNNWMFIKIETDAGIHGWGRGQLAIQRRRLVRRICSVQAVSVGQKSI